MKLKFNDLEMIFDEFRGENKVEMNDSRKVAKTKGGYLVLSPASDGGTLSLFASKPITYYDFLAFWTMKVIAGKYDSNFCVNNQDVARCSYETKRTILDLMSRFQSLKKNI